MFPPTTTKEEEEEEKRRRRRRANERSKKREWGKSKKVGVRPRGGGLDCMEGWRDGKVVEVGGFGLDIDIVYGT